MHLCAEENLQNQTSKNPNAVVQAQKKQSDCACRKKDCVTLTVLFIRVYPYQTNVATLFLFY